MSMWPFNYTRFG